MNEIRELARLLPDPARHELPEGRQRALREAVMARIDEDRTAGDTAVANPAPARRRRRVLVPSLVGGALALVLAVWLTSAFVLGIGKVWAGHTPAGELLNRIALAAANSDEIQPIDQIRDDQFVYIKTYGAGAIFTSTAPGWSEGTPSPREIWLSVDGSAPGLVRDAAGTDTVLPPHQPNINAPTLPYLRGLTADPDLLLLKIYRETRGMGQSRQQEAFATIGDLIREQVVPPHLAVALYQAAARIPDVTVIDDVVDALGRHGIGIAHPYANGAIRQEWIFDRNTLQYLGERDVLTGKPLGAPEPPGGSFSETAGTVIASTAVMARAIVDHAGDLPG
jgi:hypothetical protein